MILHPAPRQMLADYCAGALPEAVALAVAVHLALSPESRALADEIARETRSSGAARASDRTARTNSSSTALPQPLQWQASSPSRRPADIAALPAVLRTAVPVGTRWRRNIVGVEEIAVPLASERHSARLLRIAPGRGVPRHTHRGTEHTVVIAGSFHDGHDHYGAGDMCVAGAIEHTPVAAGEEICIALVVLERPIVLTGPIGRVFNPLQYRRLSHRVGARAPVRWAL